jgi:hypothetical protein
MDDVVSPTGVEQLLGHFLVGALGLTLGSAIRDAGAAPARGVGPGLHTDPSVCAAWNTERGVVRICGTYDRGQSLQLSLHVLLIEWWIAPAIHHRSWWRCSARRPREWMKGYGSEACLNRSVDISGRHRDPVSGVDEAVQGILDSVGSGRCDA